MINSYLVASAILHPVPERKAEALSWLEEKIQSADTAPPAAERIRKLLRKEQGTPIEPFKLDPWHEDLAVLLIQLASVQQKRTWRVVIGSKLSPHAGNGLIFTRSLKPVYNNFWVCDNDARSYSDQERWPGAWIFRPYYAGSPTDAGVDHANVRLYSDEGRIRLVIRLPKRIPALQISSWTLQVNGDSGIQKLGLSLKRWRQDTVAILPQTPESIIRLLAHLENRSVIDLYAAPFRLRIQLEPPVGGPLQLKCVIGITEGSIFPWLNLQETSHPPSLEKWMIPALDGFAPFPDPIVQHYLNDLF